MLTDLYCDRKTAVHRARPEIKLLVLLLLCSLVFVLDTWPVLIAVSLATTGLCAWARIPGRYLVRSLSPAFWFLLAIFLVQLYLSDIEMAAFVVLRFATMIMAASLVTMTTRSGDMVDGLERALVFVPNEKIRAQISLSLTLCLRFIPRVRHIFREVRDAQKARGLSNDWRALAIPTIIRTLKSAEEIAQAIEARSA